MCFLTYISSTQSTAQGPWPDVCSLIVDGQTLHAANKATICPCRFDQPVSAWRSTDMQWGAEGDLTILTLRGQEEEIKTSLFIF